MALTVLEKMVAGGFQTIPNAGAPVTGTTEVQTLTIGGTPTGGTFSFAMNGYSTAQITWSATNATLLANINAALDAQFGAGQIVATATSLTAGIGTIALTFSGSTYAVRAISSVFTVVNNLTGTSPTTAVARTTTGVQATHRSASVGQLLVDTTTSSGETYQNTGAVGAPTWSKVGTQS